MENIFLNLLVEYIIVVLFAYQKVLCLWNDCFLKSYDISLLINQNGNFDLMGLDIAV